MDAVIKAAVKEELRRQMADQSKDETQPKIISEESTSQQQTQSQTSNLSSRTVTRLSGLLDRVRSNSKRPTNVKKRKNDKEHRIHVRWIHYNSLTKTFETVRQRNGGGNRFISYNASAPPNVEELKLLASKLFFPEGMSVFAGDVDDMQLAICDTTQTAIFEFPGAGTLDNFLKENGLYSSTTYLYLRPQAKDLIYTEFQDDILESSVDNFVNATSTSHRIVCTTCNCSYTEGQSCLRCEQNRELEESIIKDHSEFEQYLSTSIASTSSAYTNDAPLNIEEVRQQRIAFFSTESGESDGNSRENSIAASSFSEFETITSSTEQIVSEFAVDGQSLASHSSEVATENKNCSPNMH